MNNPYYILEGHKPKAVDSMTWGEWFATAERHVRKTDIKVPAWKFGLGKLLKIKKWELVNISTVFVGIDHRFDVGGPPLLFETMVFGGEYDQYTERYSTWDEAEEGHKEIVRRVFERELNDE